MKALLLAVFLLTPSARAAGPELVEATPPGDVSGTTVHRLANGLTIYLSPNHESPRVASNIIVRAGSKNDPADSTGMAHYLEHMLFKGTMSLGTLDAAKEAPRLERIRELYEKRFSATDPAERDAIYKDIDAENVAASKYAVPNELSKLYSQLGVHGLNAYTSDEMTVYVSNFPSNRAEAWATVEAERFSRPVFRLFLGELETVYEEKNRSLDNAGRILSEAINRAMYGDHPYGRTTLGSIEHLKNPSLTKMYEFFDRWYVPENMAIALAGDFDREEMLALLDGHFGAWKRRAPGPDEPRTLPVLRGEKVVETRYEAEEMVELVWPTVPVLHPDADALQALGLILSNGRTGIVDLTLKQTQKVKSAGGGAGFYNEAGEFMLYAVPKLGQTPEQARDLLLGAAEKAKAGKFDEEDLKGAVVNYEVAEKYRLESNESRVRRMTGAFIRGESWASASAGLERLRRVKKRDVVRVARKYLGKNRVLAYRRNGKPDLPRIVKPVFTKLSIDAERRSAFAAKVLALPATPLTPRWLEQGRDYEIRDMRSGRLYAAKNPFNDLFTLTFSFDRGRRQERQLCSALGVLELAGAGELSPEEYKRRLYRLGSGVSYGCGENGSSVSLYGLDENLEATLKLMRARFERPALTDAQLADAVHVAVGAHRDTKKNPAAVLRALGEVARRGKDGSVLNELSDDELRALKRENLEELVRGVFGYARKVSYVGNRAPEEIVRLVDDGGAKAPPAREPLRLLKPARPKVYFAHRDMVQAQAGVFAADGILDPEKAVDYAYYARYVGGGMGAVIFQEIREARSLAYSAGGGYDRGNREGDENAVYGYLGCQADKTIEALTLLGRLLRRPPLAGARFSETKRALEEAYRDNPTPFRSIPGAVISWEEDGIKGGDPRPKRFERTERYRLKDLKRFSARFRDRPLSYYVLGHRDRVDLKALKAMGDFEEKTVDELFPY